MIVDVVSNYKRVCEEIVSASEQYGRKADEITLLPVTKGVAWEPIEPLYREGCHCFGESRLQESLIKIQAAPADVKWHFIGTLQKNKVRKVLEYFLFIHSVDSLDLAQKISTTAQELNLRARVLLEVNTSGEEAKHGFDAKSLLTYYEQLIALPMVQIEGLMTMAPLVEDEGRIRKCFSTLRLLRDNLNRRFGKTHTMDHLSMGMSHDYRYAIAEGATILRIGSAIFS